MNSEKVVIKCLNIFVTVAPKQNSEMLPRTKMERKLSRDKINLQLVAKKAPVTTEPSQQIILVEWDGIGEHFFNGAVFSSRQANLKFHVFVNKTEKENVKIRQLHQYYGDQVVLHESLTESKEAPWTDLLAYLINFHTKTLMSCIHCSVQFTKPRFHISVVAGQKDRYTELKALLKSEHTETKVIDGWKTTILNLFKHVCFECKIIFPDKHLAEKHDRDSHNFLCKNRTCQYSKRENGFFNYDELIAHEEKKKRCEFCKKTYFCDAILHQKHMDKLHIKCTCSCEKYYRNNTEFIEHYCRTYPLPCLESPECETRFKNIDEMAFHHKQVHGSTHPYYCIACYSQSKLVYVHTAEDLMAHVSEANHQLTDFELVIIPNEELINSEAGQSLT